MRCQDVESRIDELVDGALAEAERGELEQHLEACPACRSLEARTRALLAEARALPRGVDPPVDLWPGIAARIEKATVARGAFGAAAPARRRALVAAAAVAAAAGLATVVLVARHAPGPAGSEARAAAGPGVTTASLGLAQAQATYAAARTQLLAALAARRATLSPQTVAVVEKNLRIIDGAVAEMQAALARDPGNREIPALLVAAYQQEIDLLQRVTSLPGRG